jgi:hypothetical protein
MYFSFIFVSYEIDNFLSPLPSSDAVAKEMRVCITNNMTLEYNILRVWILKVALNAPDNKWRTYIFA